MPSWHPCRAVRLLLLAVCPYSLLTRWGCRAALRCSTLLPHSLSSSSRATVAHGRARHGRQRPSSMATIVPPPQAPHSPPPMSPPLPRRAPSLAQARLMQLSPPPCHAAGSHWHTWLGHLGPSSAELSYPTGARGPYDAPNGYRPLLAMASRP